MGSGFDQAQRPAELGFILTDLLLEYNDVLRMSATQNVNLDLIVHGMQGHCSTFTDNDKRFKEEWLALQAERNALGKKKDYEGYYPGAEGFEAEDLAFRVREMSILERSAYRMGIISKIESNRTKWDPLAVAREEGKEVVA